VSKGVIRKGSGAISEVTSGSSDFVRIGDGDAVDMVSLSDLDEMLSVDQHAIWLEGGNSPMFPCIGKNCPGEELGNDPRFRAFLPVVLLETSEEKIFSFGISIARALEELDEEFGGLSGHVFRVKRKGSGLSTTYTVVALGRTRKIDKYEMPDVEEKIGPTTRKGILDLLEETGAIEDLEDFVDEDEDEDEEEEEVKPKKKKPKKKPAAKKKKPKKKAEEEEEDDEDWEDL
jgi:hypothetical protein